MATKIYSSGNYVIVETDTQVFEYAKGHTLYVLTDDVFYIKEITQGQFKVAVADIDAGDIQDNEGTYTVETFTTFLRENTGFKTAPGGSGAVVSTGSPTPTTNIWVGTQAQYNALTPNSATLYFIQ
jgi:hypothetical protein